MTRKRLAVIGGGAAGASLLWCLSSQDEPRARFDATLFHDQAELGGHARTIPVRFDAAGKGHVAGSGERAGGTAATYPIDLGVQFVCPSLQPNLYRQLQLPELRHVRLTRHPQLRVSGAFDDALVWGNFAEYQRGARFTRCFDAGARADAERFERDLHRAPFLRLGGRRVAGLSVGEYVDAAGIRRDGNFFRYLLIPYLCMLDGCATADLLETTMAELWPIFTRLPFVRGAGAYASFLEPGYGWDRFTDGATAWVRAMAETAEIRGARVRLASTVSKLERRGREWVVHFRERGVIAHAEAFDSVALTTDMTANRALLDHDENPFRPQHARCLSSDRFRQLPEVCYIHQDASLLAPSLADEREDAQFTGYFARRKRDADRAPYDLPYDLAACFQTYMLHNVLHTPARCYVSTYAQERGARLPAKDTIIFERSVRRARWAASFSRQGKRELHAVQGLGDVWFAGNDTGVHSEEGALLSAMIVAAQAAGYRYPFEHGSLAWLTHGYFHQQMFPAASLRARARRLLTGLA